MEIYIYIFINKLFIFDKFNTGNIKTLIYVDENIYAIQKISQ